MTDTAPLVLALLLVVPASALAQDPGSEPATLEPPDLRTGEYWSYDLVGPNGSARADGGTARTSVGAPGPNGTREVVTRTTFEQPVRNGSFEVDSRTRLQVRDTSLHVVARESVTVRNGSFEGKPVWSYTRNLTTFGEAIPLLPAPSDPGDVWRTETYARSVVNQTNRVGTGDDADTVDSQPVRYNTSLNQTLRVEAVGNVTVPAGTFEGVVVNRTRTTQPGYTLEWWADEPGYIARWETRDDGGNLTGGAVLTDWGRNAPPGDGLDWVQVGLVAAGLAVVTGLAALAYRRRS